jgi:hypothetical protein
MAPWSVVASLAKIIPSVKDHTLVEALVVWGAVSFGVSQGFQRVILEGDSLLMTSALAKDSPCWNTFEFRSSAR